jgi:hypothetical protein
MNNVSIFWMQLTASVFALTVISVWYVWPALTKVPLKSALTILLFAHVPRYVGMTLLVPGVVDSKLPSAFLSGAAYGDLLEAGLALACIFLLRTNWRVAIPLVWVTNIWGFVDLVNGVRGLLQINLPSYDLGTFWFIYIFYAPVVLVTHLLIFLVLVKAKSWQMR